MANLKFSLHAVWRKPDEVEILIEDDDEEPEDQGDVEMEDDEETCE